MPNEFDLHKAAKLGDEAKNLLDSPLLKASFDKLKQSYIDMLMQTDATQSSVRDKYWMAARVVDVVMDHLTNVLNNGVVAKSDLEKLANEGDRKRRFGIV